MSHFNVSVPHRVRVGTLLFIAALTSSVLLPPSSDARRRSCLRGHVALVAASESIRVVRARTHPEPRVTRDRYLACDSRDGRRFEVYDDVTVENEGRYSVRLEIVQDRYVGVLSDSSDAIVAIKKAAVWDAKRRRRLHTSSGCDKFGPLEAVFLPGGGLAYACDALFLDDADGKRRLEPPEAEVHDLAVSNRVGGPPLLQWFVGDQGPGAGQQRSLQLP